METGKVRLKDVSPSDWIRCKYCQCFISTSSFVGHREQHRKERFDRGGGKIKAIESSQNGLTAPVRIKKEIPVIDLENSDEEQSDGFPSFSTQCSQDPSNQPTSPSSPGFEGDSDEFGSDLNLLRCEECEEYFFTGTDYDNHTAKYHEFTDAAADPLDNVNEAQHDDSSCAESGSKGTENACLQTTSQSIQIVSNHPRGSPIREKDSDGNELSDSSVILNSSVAVVPQSFSDINGSSTIADDDQELTTSSVEERQSETSDYINSGPSSPSSQESSTSQDSSSSEDEMQNSKSEKYTKRKTYPQIQEYYVQRAAAKKLHQYNDNICPYCDKDCQSALRWESHVRSKHEKKRKVKSKSKRSVAPKIRMVEKKTVKMTENRSKRLKLDLSSKRVKVGGKPKEVVANRRRNSSPKPCKGRKDSKENKRTKISAVRKTKQSLKTIKCKKPPKEGKSKMYSRLTKAECPLCKVSITTQGLPYHIRIHTGEKPFSCRYCARKFRGRSIMYNHEKRCRKKLTVVLPNNQEKKIAVKIPLVIDRHSPPKTVSQIAPSEVIVKSTQASTLEIPANIGIRRGVKRKSSEIPLEESTKTCSVEDQLVRRPKSSNDDKKLYLCDVCDFATFRCSELDTHIKSHLAEEKLASIPRNVEVGKDSGVINSLRCKLIATTETQSKLQGIKDDGLNQKTLLSPINNQKQVAKGRPSNSVNSYRCLLCLRICGGESLIREHIKKFHGQTLQTIIRTDEDPCLGKRILKLAKKVSSFSRRRTLAENEYDDPSRQADSVDETLPRLIVKVQGEVVAACSVLSPRRPELNSSERNPFPCEFCSEKFVNHDDYLLHVVHHKGAAIRSCNQCGKTFMHSEFFLQHMSESHNVSVNLVSAKNKSPENRKVRLNGISKSKLMTVKNVSTTVSAQKPPTCYVAEKEAQLSMVALGLPDDNKEKESEVPLENQHPILSPPATEFLTENENISLPSNGVTIQLDSLSNTNSIQNAKYFGDKNYSNFETSNVVGGQSTPRTRTFPLTPGNESESYLNICDSTTQITDLVAELQEQQLSISIPPPSIAEKSTVPYSVAADPISPPLPGELNTFSPLFFTTTPMEWFSPDVSKRRENKAVKEGNLMQKNSFRDLEMLSLIATLEPPVRSPVEDNAAGNASLKSCEFIPLTAINGGPENEHTRMESSTTAKNGYSKNFDSVIKLAGKEGQFQPTTTENSREFDNNVRSAGKVLARRQCPFCCLNYESQLALEDHLGKVHDPKNLSIAAAWTDSE